MKQSKLILVLIAAVMFLVLGCGLLGTQIPNTGDDQAVYTQAVQTLQAQLTQQAFDNLIKQLTQAAGQPSLSPTFQPTMPTATLLTPGSPSVTPFAPTVTVASPTPVPPSPTTVQIRCNQAEFVSDVSVVDGTVFTPGARYTKTWRLRNAGSCTWDDDYSLVFVDGDRMQGARETFLDEVVRPGERVDISVDLVAPNAAGRYQGFWMLSDRSGARFGIGRQALDAFWVDIRVAIPNSSYAYDFGINLCAAGWESSASDLSCPGNTNDEDGSVALLDRPVLENSRVEDELAIWMRPEATRGGWISGIYPEYEVKQYDHFLADIGCLADSQGCALTFALDYQTPNGRIHNLGEWYEEYDGIIGRIKVDLSSLAGRRVKFILSVTNEGRANRGNGFWLVPSIRNIKPVPTPTPTPVPTWSAALRAAIETLAWDAGIEPSTLTMISVEAVNWKDSCLGIPTPDQVCLEVIIPGYRFVLESGIHRYEAHTNLDGSLVFWFELS